MTMQDYRDARYEEFFLALVIRELDWEEAKDVVLNVPDYPDGITAIDALKISVEQALIENNEEPTEENKKRIEEDVKKSITTHLERWEYVILLKHGEQYIDLSEMNEMDSRYKIRVIVPFKEYYSEDDYCFEEDEEGPYLSIEMDGFNKFVEDCEAGKFD